MNRAEFFRYARLVHGWLSAFAFIALCLFAVTGLLLNHPEWINGDVGDPDIQKISLTPAMIEELDWADAPAILLTDYVNEFVTLKGELTGGNKVGAEIFARLQGVKGLTDLRANLNTGEVEIIVESAPWLVVFNELHRGERAGKTWRIFIDVFAIITVILSLTGYLLFLMMRFRRTTALLITFCSGLFLYLLYQFAVY